MTEGRAALSGSGPQTIYINTYRSSQDYGGNFSQYRSYGIYEGNGYGSWTNATQYWSANLGGVAISGTFTIPSPGTGSITLYDYWWNRYHDGNGYGSGFTSTFCVDTNHSSIGDGCVSVGEETPPRIPKRPQPVGAPSPSAVTPTTLTMSWSAPDNMGAGIDQYILRRNTVSPPESAGYVDYVTSGLSYNVTGLTPGTTYYWAVYAHNSQGYSDRGGITTQATPPASPPGVTVVASPAGTSATVTLTPPGGVSNVTSYTVSATYTAPAPIPNPATITQTGSSPMTFSGLIPGATYSWTATALISGYTSPASTPQSLTQPQPTTNPGNYFDGNTPDKPDVDYAWTGTANNSTSTGTAPNVQGWQFLVNGSGSTAVISRVTGGYAGSYAARVNFLTDATAAGAIAGVARNADVATNGTYWGSIWVYLPARTQRLAARLTFSATSGGASVGQAIGVDTLVPAATWTRLAVIGTAPATGEWAGIDVIDVSGAGWVAWKGGDQMLLDAAMISLGELYTYFDGDTPDSINYDYSWTGAANASSSVRSTLAVPNDELVDPDCPPIPAPPRPPVVPSDCIIDVGVWRRYWAYIPPSEVSDWLVTLPTLELETSASAERQVRIRYYQDPFNRSYTQINTDDYCGEQIISYIPPSTIMTLDAMTERVYAEVNGGASVPADHLLYGSGGTPAEWPQLSCGIGYWVSLDVPATTPAGNLSVRGFLTQRV
jgi:hypothetical protein